jgi:diguanylate cyclase (GGDEF)-like protein/PAS domain S-box-containing protein
MKGDGVTDRILLLIDNDPSHAEVFRKALLEASDGPFKGERVKTLAASIERLRSKDVWAIFLNLSLPDSQGLQTFERLSRAVGGVPTLVLGGVEDKNLVLEALRHGAKDYILEDHLDSYAFIRAIRNMVERETAEEALFTEKERAQVTLDFVGDAVLGTDIEGKVTYLNVVAEKMTGWTRAEALGKPLHEVFVIIDGTTGKTCQNPLKTAIESNRTVGLTPHCMLVRRDGYESAIEDSVVPIHDRQGLVTGAVIVFHDVSVAGAMALEMSHADQHDVLTGLPNRGLVKDRITQAIALARRRGTALAVFFLDLDGFKYINDSLGHAVGDKLLQSVAKRLVGCVRGSDTVGRQGGDEFVVLLPEIADAKDAAISAQKIIVALAEPHSVNQRHLQVTTSMGISVYPNVGPDAETLVKTADTAMYFAKESGRNNYKLFEPEMNVRVVERQSIEVSLRGALERHEFVLYYQPKINLETGTITGVEALIRWVHPDRGSVPPLQFIPVAEDCGLILPIGKWALREACRQARAWQDAGLLPVPIAVNISAVEFLDGKLLESVCTILKETGLEPRYLEIELTETVLMRHAKSTIAVLQALKAMGVQLAVDDFGTGYSSLSYLIQFPIDILKVDQSFVHKIDADSEDATMIGAMINMGRSLKHRVIAEGVETAEQFAFLRAHGCGEGQGYYFSRPVPAAQFAKLLETGMSVAARN